MTGGSWRPAGTRPSRSPFRADGSMRVFLSTKSLLHDVQGQVVGIVGVSRDITERKQNEEALRAAKDSAEHAKAGAEQANRARTTSWPS